MQRYQMIESVVMFVHFEKGHMIPTTRFDPEHIEPYSWVFPLRLTQLARGYASQGPITMSLTQATWIEKVKRDVWHRLAEDMEDIMIAPADEVRPILIHMEHHQNEGPYSCDCNVVLENPDARLDQHVWRVDS